MIYTLGCSFTKWHWPTWADWVRDYLQQPVDNLAGSGYTNALIYQQLLTRCNQITKNDTVYIMWTGSNRNCVWYDREYVEQQDCLGFFPDTNGRLWYGDNLRGLYKTHPTHLPSFTHMIVDMFDTVFKTQMLLENIGCNYRMMFWRNPWADIREKFVPVYSTTWNHKKILSKDEIATAKQIIAMLPVSVLLKNINWNKFVSAPGNPLDPASYRGLWEFTLDNKELLLMNHASDDHPNTLAHHDWTVDIVLPGTHPSLREHANRLATDFQTIPVPTHDRSKEIINFRT